ncbi:Exonuclease V - a 5' deoxyribonuclease family protein [Cryptosporidium meleagridis]|uniref:Exonuclease V-a 5' deoxyribonuclease family protein n=1 Tax=Cryptosporidium meleagridis TaxID=93969 RepID=A0A2P4Z655_9CRYT|nr:Exonuclease V - a 5' deoxyribonuclease family protein [Cryptosporidium meleagridis]
MNISSFRIKRRKKSEDDDGEKKESSSHEELLEVIAPINKFKSKPALGVTTFSRQMWCEKSLEICLENNIKITSKAIEEGIKHHEELELEDHQVLSVMVENEYEKMAIEILSIVNLLDGLIERGYIRELPIIGFYKGIMLRGIIDSLQLKPKLNGIGGTNNVKYSSNNINKFIILISDTKTRRNTTLPSNVQQKTTVLQLGLYRKILGEMINSGKTWKSSHPNLIDSNAIKKYLNSSIIDLSNCCSGCSFLNSIFEFHGLDPLISFSLFQELEDAKKKQSCKEKNDVCDINQDPIETETHSETESVVDTNGKSVLKEFENALEIGFNMLLSFSKLPDIQSEMKVEYDCQGKTFATKWYKSSEQTIELELDYLLSWWLGAREAEFVRMSEAWKCKFCNVIEYCQACPLSKEEKEKCIEKIRQEELESLLIKDLEESYNEHTLILKCS